MATWVVHFRLTEALLDMGFNFDRKMFLVGNIAPDSGLLNDEKTGYEPSSEITHWHGADGNIYPENFYNTYIVNCRHDPETYAFLMGYYCHLIADVEWIERIWRPKKRTPLYAEPLAQDPQFAWEIKKDWYGLDFLYLRENPQSIFYTDFVQIGQISDYLDYFPAGAFTKRIEDTRLFYLCEPDWELNRPYIYLNRQEWEDYIASTTDILTQTLTRLIAES
jgi:hypothetical protein